MRGIIGLGTLAPAGLAAAALLLAAPAPEASGQGAIGFQPVVTPFADGVFLNATPAVSADRRYVRFGGLNASFQSLNGVQPFGFTAGAVSGGGVPFGVGAGGLGAVGGMGGMGGAAVVPGLGAVAPVGGFAFGWPGYYGNPYGYFGTVSGIPAGPIATGPFYGGPFMAPQTFNALAPTGWSIMNAVAPGSWRFGGR